MSALEYFRLGRSTNNIGKVVLFYICYTQVGIDFKVQVSVGYGLTYGYNQPIMGVTTRWLSLANRNSAPYSNYTTVKLYCT